MVAVTYIMIAIGCERGGLSFWRSILWPIAVGEMIARRAAQQPTQEG